MGILDRALNVGEAKIFRRHEQRVVLIGAYEAELKLDTDEELRERMDVLREQAHAGSSLDELLPECFAIVREIGERRMGMRHFDVQLIGGMVLHGGAIAEMRTGEGKTLTATLAVVLNSLAGNGVHVVTVNDYLARRDAEWMSPIYDALGVTVGVLQAHQPIEAAREILAVSEELELRKVQHREFSNLQYLVGAALQRAADRQIDTTAARALLDESLRSQETDYDVAVAKAREALKLLEGVLQGVEPPASAWPFHRLPSP